LASEIKVTKIITGYRLLDQKENEDILEEITTQSSNAHKFTALTGNNI
jgi:hypothetical protein